MSTDLSLCRNTLLPSLPVLPGSGSLPIRVCRGLSKQAPRWREGSTDTSSVHFPTACAQLWRAPPPAPHKNDSVPALVTRLCGRLTRHCPHIPTSAGPKALFDRKHRRKLLPTSAQERCKETPAHLGVDPGLSRAAGMQLSLCQSQHGLDLRCESNAASLPAEMKRQRGSLQSKTDYQDCSVHLKMRWIRAHLRKLT